MKRVFQRKAQFFPGSSSAPKASTTPPKRANTDNQSRSKTSVAMLGLALSVGASGSLLTCQDDQAVAAEPRKPTFTSVIDDSTGEPTAARALPAAEVTEPSSPRAIPPLYESEATQHIVREGETLWNLSRRYRISPDTLAAANQLGVDNILQVGQAIKIPLAASGPAPLTQQTPSESSNPAVGRNLAQLQVLNASEDIADATDAASLLESVSQEVGVDEVGPSVSPKEGSGPAQASQAVEPTLTGDAPNLSTTADAIAKPSAANGPEFSIAATATLQPVPSVNEPEPAAADSHRIRPGETLASIARQHGISVEALAQANGIRNPNRIFAGRMLEIPSPEPSSQPEAIAQPVSPAVVVATASQTFDTTLPLNLEPASAAAAASFPTPQAIIAPTVPTTGLDDTDSDNTDQDDSDLNPAVLDHLNPGTDAAQFKEPDVQPDSTDAPSNTAMDTVNPEPRSEVALADNSSSVDINPYVRNLMGEIEALSAQYESSQGRVNAQEVRPETVAALLSAPADAQYLQSGNAVNPEFNRPVQVTDVETTGESAPATVDADEPVSLPPEPVQSTPDRSEQLVAVAPLGSENYVPLDQPVTGRMVSPELPPLPGPDHYLPNGTGRFNGYLWPARGVLTSGYGWRWGRMHRGIDIAAPVGTPIYAAAPGVIEFSGWNSGGYGNMVDIRHPDGSKTRYAHNSRNLVRVGQQVQQGQQIAEMGSTGYSTGPHVHFEVHLPERGTVNPIAYLPQER